MGRGMADNITRIPTAPKSYITIRKVRGGWQVVLATPAGARPLRTALYWAADRGTAVAKGQEVAARMKRPLKAKLGGGNDC